MDRFAGTLLLDRKSGVGYLRKGVQFVEIVIFSGRGRFPGKAEILGKKGQFPPLNF